jgi:hypothetical protein
MPNQPASPYPNNQAYPQQYPSAPSAPRNIAFLRSEISGVEFQLDPSKEAMLGRGDRARGLLPEIELSDSAALSMGVSRLHSKIIFSGGTFYIIDLNSTNHTYLNGVALTPQQAYSLQNGDRIKLGSYPLIFYVT